MMRPPTDFLVLPASVSPATLKGLRAPEVLAAIDGAPIPIFATVELKIVAINKRATPAFAEFPDVIGQEWPDFLRRYWTPEAANDVIEIVTKTLATGTPFASIGFTATRATGVREEQFD